MIMSSTTVTIRFLVTSLTKALLHQLLSLASSQKSPTCAKLLPLRVTETTCFCDPSMKHNCFLNSSDVWLDAILSLSSVLLTPGLGLCSDVHFQLLDILLRLVPFQIIPIQLNVPQVTFTRSAVTSTSNKNALELDFNCPR